MDDKLMADLYCRIVNCYGSLSAPNYEFVQKAMVDKPYNALVDELQKSFTIEDLTSFNIDVSFRYFITQKDERWVLELSMLGPYAILCHVDQHDPPLHQSTPTLSESEKNLIKLLASYGISLLEKDILEQPIDLVLFNTESEYVRMYQALFADTWLLPWETYEALRQNDLVS